MASWILDSALQALDLRSEGGWTLVDERAVTLATKVADELRAGALSGEDLLPLLKLIVALDADPDSKAASREFIRILRAEPEVRSAVAERTQSLESGAREFRARFSSDGGVRRAPRVGAAAPDGAISGRELLSKFAQSGVRGRR